jgi:UDP-N-acetylmuramoylalanine--D-glutamate ligase
MKNWNGARILIIGAARQGLALARYFAARGGAVILNDQNLPEKLASAQAELEALPVEWVLGSHPLALLDRTDLVCVSGGVPLTIPLISEAIRRGMPVSNDSQIFMEEVPCRVIAVTGSAGKTTTTTLVGRMAQEACTAPLRANDTPHHAWVGGNIGRPLIDLVGEIAPTDLVVLELSSFQLELMTQSPWIGTVLNITPNHLDRHGTMEAYTAAKARILNFQGPQDIAVLGREDPGAWGLAAGVRGGLITFGLEPPAAGVAGTFRRAGRLYWRDAQGEQDLGSTETILLRGEYNLLNVLAACAVGIGAGFSVSALQAGIAGFSGVPHRLELVRELGGVRWYNNSIATAPERTIAAIRAFDEPIVLMLGGRDKNLPWETLATLAHERVDHIVVFGEATEKILAALGPVRSGRLKSITRCSGTEEAVQAAANLAQPGSVVLFSPGGTSYDQFKDFEERGERYRQWVKQLS